MRISNKVYVMTRGVMVAHRILDPVILVRPQTGQLFPVWRNW